jgi:hypothetical protein
MKKAWITTGILVTIVLLAGCAPGPNALANTASAGGVVAGFWRGLWNGVISPITFIISLFNSHVQIYEVHNNGGWYNFGFLFGLSIILGGGGASARRSRR